MSNWVFALDIGTRSIIGVVAELEEEKIKIKAQHMLEHDCRAMYDGQIHDIPKVASGVAQVKAVLEEKIGHSLDHVAIAAAGRALVTRHCKVEMEIDEFEEIDSTLVRALDMTGVHQAYQELGQELSGSNENTNFYCVGYSIVSYYLNDYSIGNLIGHRGKIIGAEVLATFLPDTVVNSLHAVLERVNLQPISLTLEPIAAIDITIPPEIRTLNLALVDIGAGTSDIAITNDGSITAYGMVPMAGDEITDAIVKACLVDFNTAEKIKCSLNNEQITYKDILGIENVISASEVMKIIDPVINQLADKIVAEVLKLNTQKAPQTVFCIGGGAQIPQLSYKIAERLQLPKLRVAVRGRDILNNVVQLGQDPIGGPEGITVLGIAFLFLEKVGYNFITITVNDQDYSLFRNDNLTVASALGMIGYNLQHLMADNGVNLTFSLNGSSKIVYGELGRPAEITVNNQPATLQTSIKEHDVIKIIEASDGAAARLTVKELLQSLGLEWVDCKVTVNGQNCIEQYLIQQHDQLEITSLNNQHKTSGQQKQLSEAGAIEQLNKAQLPTSQPGKKWATVTVNGETITLENLETPVFLDIFNFIDLDLTQAKGIVTLTCNGQRAEYTQPLADGDIIEIYWPQSGKRRSSNF